jgi:hypothetical protein
MAGHPWDGLMKMDLEFRLLNSVSKEYIEAAEFYTRVSPWATDRRFVGTPVGWP